MFNILKLNKFILHQWQSLGHTRTQSTREALSVTQHKHYRRIFERLDSNDDGFLTKEDLAKGLSKCLEIKPTENQLQKALEMLSKPGRKGPVHFDDLVRYYITKKLPSAEDFKREFLVIDKDHDGFVAETDLRDWYITIENDSLHRLYDKYLPCEVKMYEFYKNGRISLDDYIEINATLFLLASIFDLPVFRETFP